MAVVLSEVTEVGGFRPFYGAGICGQVAGQAAQQGGLTDAVRADNGYPFAGLYLQTQVLEQGQVIVMLAEPF